MRFVNPLTGRKNSRRVQNAKWQREWKRQQLESGRCLDCKEGLSPGETRLCAKCLKTDSLRKNAKRNERRETDQCCPECGKVCLMGPSKIRICLSESCLKKMYRYRHLKDGVPIPSPEEAAVRLMLMFIGFERGSLLPPGYLTFEQEWLQRRARLVMQMAPGYYGS
jgi:hypothetical protein